ATVLQLVADVGEQVFERAEREVGALDLLPGLVLDGGERALELGDVARRELADPAPGVLDVLALPDAGAGERSAVGHDAISTSFQHFAHIDRGRVGEARVRLARGLDVAQRTEKPLIFSEYHPHAQAHAGHAAAPRLGFDR